MAWTQVYYPFESAVVSTLVAAIPIVVLLGLLASGRVSAPRAALVGLLLAFLIALFAYVPEDMPGTTSYGERVGAWFPVLSAAAGHGVAFGLFPIGWIVLTAIFLYSLTVETGHFEIIKQSVASLSDDRRIQALLIAFCFGAFVEGCAGFGTPVAISAALMVGAGFRPLYAAGLALIANTAPVAFGALGTPTITLADVTQLPVQALSAMAGRQLPVFSLIVPVWLVWTMSGWRGVRGVWPALLVAGGSFATVQFLVANYLGPTLVDVAGGLISLLSLALLLRVWKPAQVWRFPEETEAPPVQQHYTFRQTASAWVPWLLLTGFMLVWGLRDVKAFLDEETVIKVNVPALHKQIARDRPVVVVRTPEPAVFTFNWLSATGTGILLAAMASALWLRVQPRVFLRVFVITCYRMRWPLFTIACMLAIAFVTRYSGMDATLGLAFTKTGVLYPLCAALLGWLGVALTGSDTSSNALFGGLQTITARGLVRDELLPLSEFQAMVLLASANSTGGVMGKMIDAQSIVVSAAATGQPGQEGPILRFVFWHSLALAILMGLLVLVQAHWLQGLIPEQ
jgi:lactate permease